MYPLAKVVELVDTLDSKSSAGNSVWVRVPPLVQNRKMESLRQVVALFLWSEVGREVYPATKSDGSPTFGTKINLGVSV